MKLFRKKKKVTDNPRTEELANRIAGRIVRVQHRLADYLNAKAFGVDNARKRLYLILFILLFGAVNLWLLIGSITNQ